MLYRIMIIIIIIVFGVIELNICLIKVRLPKLFRLLLKNIALKALIIIELKNIIDSCD